MVTSVYKELNVDNKVQHFMVGHCISDYLKQVICTKIDLHEPMGEGDRCYCDCYFSDNRIIRLYNPDMLEKEAYK